MARLIRVYWSISKGLAKTQITLYLWTLLSLCLRASVHTCKVFVKKDYPCYLTWCSNAIILVWSSVGAESIVYEPARSPIPTIDSGWALYLTYDIREQTSF